jgi:D-alanine-D-alanine ligase-like ATP-grasp enzyme
MLNKIEVNIGKDVYGFRDEHRQPQCSLSIYVKQPELYFSADAAKFLQVAFGLTAPLTTISLAKPSLHISTALKGFISTTGSIAQHLLEQGSFPSFADPSVTDITTEKSNAKRAVISLLVSTERFQNQDVIRAAYLMSAQISHAFTQPRVNHNDLLNKANGPLVNFVEMAKSATKGGLSTKFVLREAYNRGLPFFCRPSGQYQIGFGERNRVFVRSATFADSAIGASLTNDKFTCIENLQAAGIPTPISRRVRDVNEAKMAANRIGFPVVIKPSDRDRGEGVAVDIKTDDALEIAFNEAKNLSNNIIVENRVPGICHRLLVFRDEVVFAFSRHPKSAVGDGATCIEMLIEKERKAQSQKAAHLRSKDIELDSIALDMLQSQGLGPHSILEKDQIAHLRPYQNPIWGGYNEVVTSSVHPANAELACRAARIFGLEIAGIDLISTDITVPWHQNGAVINEVNFQPQIGENTARAILDGYFPDNSAEIPIEIFIGDEAAMNAALDQHAALCDQSVNVFLTSHEVTIGPNRAEIPLSGLTNIFQRIEFLLKDPRVQVLIVVVQTVELATLGLPFYRISKLRVINENLQMSQADFDDLNMEITARTISLFKRALTR